MRTNVQGLPVVYMFIVKPQVLYLSHYIFMSQGGYYRNIENSTIIAFAALGLFSAAGSMYLLKQWGKQLHNDWHKM